MKKAFTLLELLIVMAVVAVLIGIAIPSFQGMQAEADKAKAQLEMGGNSFQARELPKQEYCPYCGQKLPEENKFND